MNEELNLNKEILNKNPFRVPEGYFDDFAAKVMAQLPEEKMATRHRSVIMRNWMAVAACVALAVVSVAVYFSRLENPMDSQAIAKTENVLTEEDYMDAAADYVMLDNNEIYAYLSDN